MLKGSTEGPTNDVLTSPPMGGSSFSTSLLISTNWTTGHLLTPPHKRCVHSIIPFIVTEYRVCMPSAYRPSACYNYLGQFVGWSQLSGLMAIVVMALTYSSPNCSLKSTMILSSQENSCRQITSGGPAFLSSSTIPRCLGRNLSGYSASRLTDPLHWSHDSGQKSATHSITIVLTAHTTQLT